MALKTLQTTCTLWDFTLAFTPVRVFGQNLHAQISAQRPPIPSLFFPNLPHPSAPPPPVPPGPSPSTAQREYTCQDRPGSWRFEAIDVDTYCRWKIDYVKTDACGGRGWPQDNITWIDFRAGITRCTSGGGRPIVLSVESCNDPRPGGCSGWIGSLANLWRTTGDIQATFSSVLSNLDENNGMAAFGGPGHWNDRKFLLSKGLPMPASLLRCYAPPPPYTYTNFFRTHFLFFCFLLYS